MTDNMSFVEFSFFAGFVILFSPFIFVKSTIKYFNLIIKVRFKIHFKTLKLVISSWEFFHTNPIS